MNNRTTGSGGARGDGAAGAGGDGGRKSARVGTTPAPDAAPPATRWRRRVLAVALLGVVLGAAAILVSILRADSAEEATEGEADARQAEAREPGVAQADDEPPPEKRAAHVVPRAETPPPTPESPLPAGDAAAAVAAAVAPTASSGAATPRPARSGSTAARAAKNPDGGASGPDAGARRDARAAPTARRAVQERSKSDEEAELRQVERFVAAGGATLVGRVVEADGGKPVAGTSVHVHHAGVFVEGRTDASGAFRIPGMLPGSRVVVWVGRNGDPFIDERIAVAMPVDGQVADAGTVRLLRGDELATRNSGWVGVFVTRRNGQLVLSAVSPWLPADEAGLEVGDQIAAIDGRDVTGLGPRAVTFLLRGPVGAPVTLSVRAHDDHDKRKLTLVRVLR